MTWGNIATLSIQVIVSGQAGSGRLKTTSVAIYRTRCQATKHNPLVSNAPDIYLPFAPLTSGHRFPLISSRLFSSNFNSQFIRAHLSSSHSSHLISALLDSSQLAPADPASSQFFSAHLFLVQNLFQTRSGHQSQSISYGWKSAGPCLALT